ncbi:Multifunctional CCA protein [bioreactor metagenome]|uniref:Multifunctional CCA protein n=1 Tax=bioreactor metagenome TaxID=1076179 RepID=A0A644SUI9_9ZZZZ|nr:polynucleotide adenylyltransferase [Negativicutes bacterium]
MSNNGLTERIFAETIAENGGRLYRVGGCVRDRLLGITPKDIDFCVVGMVKKNFKLLFPAAEECGKYFPVFRLTIDGRGCEVAFARTERKVGSGYKGFKISSKPKVTIEEDLFRRDTTVNSIAIDSLSGEIIDPFGGIKDIKNKILRATSQHFSDDPIRALRLAGQAARLGFLIDGDTLALASATADELGNEPVERVLAELTKVLNEAQEPAQFFRVLAQSNLLQSVFEEMAELPAEEFDRAMVKLDAVAQATLSSKLRFAALGLVMDSKSLSCWNSRMTLPGDWLNAAIMVRKVMTLLEFPNPEKIVTALDKLRRGSLTVEEFDIISKAAKLSIPALEPFKATLRQSTYAVPDELKGKDIAQWIRQQHINIIHVKGGWGT